MSHTIAFITMGCAKNEVDTRTMADALIACGFDITEDAASADMVVVNTCSFIQSATEESIAAILDAAELPNIKEGAQLVIAGCMPARYGDDLRAEFPEVAAFVSCAHEGDIVQIARDLIGGAEQGAQCDQAMDAAGFGETEHPFCAYVKISDGCDRWCSYCTIPHIRGRYHSFPKQQIYASVEQSVKRGAKEIVLIAQDTGRWGTDLEEPESLAELLSYVATGFPDIRLRAMYIQPEGITDELLETIATHSNICDYLDIPIQHVSPHILKAMNRCGSVEEYTALFDRIQQKIPGIALRTTLIAGFPGETEDDFNELISFIEDSALDYIGVFPYSREEGTRAYDMPHQVDEGEKEYRAARLRDVADAVCSANIAKRIGATTSVLVEGAEPDGQLYGRSAWQAPEVDGITFIDQGQPGEFVEVTIEDTLFYDMEGSSDHGQR